MAEETKKQGQAYATKSESTYAIDVLTGEAITSDKAYEVCPHNHYNFVEWLQTYNRKCMLETCEFYDRPYHPKGFWDRIKGKVRGPVDRPVHAMDAFNGEAKTSDSAEEVFSQNH